MTFDEAIALQPVWVGYWLNVLLLGAFILPALLVFWKESRLAGIVTLATSALSAAGVMWIFSEQSGFRSFSSYNPQQSPPKKSSKSIGWRYPT